MDQTESHEAIQALERFVAENDELLELEERIGRFNVFDALRIARTEIRHSNFLAWLLGPNESHGQGDIFLKAVLMDVLRKAREQGVAVPVSAIELDGAELHSAEVRREWRSLDLLIDSPAPSFVVAFENKVDSGEHSNQLNRYEQIVRSEFSGKPHLLVFLTPDGEEASDDDWVAYSYADLHRVLTRVKVQTAGSLGGDVAVFLDHYLKLIGSRFMNDPEIDRLCRQIYANHTRAIELIMDRVDVGGSGIAATATRWLQDNSKSWRVSTSHVKYVRFIPVSWIGTVVTDDGSPLRNGAELFFELEVGRTALKLRCVVGRVDDPERRKRIIQRLIKDRKEFGFRMARKEPTERWTRIYAERIMQFTEDDVPADDAIRNVLNTWLGEFDGKSGLIARAVLEVK